MTRNKKVRRFSRLIGFPAIRRRSTSWRVATFTAIISLTFFVTFTTVFNSGSNAQVVPDNSLNSSISSLNSSCDTKSNDNKITKVNQIIKPTEANKSIPYVISPRNTFLDTLKPTIRWNEVPGASSYTVKIVRDSEVVWTAKDVRGTEFKSSENLPLESGVAYSVIVESDNGQSSEMDLNKSELEFTVLNEQEIDNVLNIIAKKEQEIENDETLRLVRLVNIYREYGLNAKAIELLEQKTNNLIQSTEIYLELGNFYQIVGLYLSAQKQYQTLLDLIKDEKEPEVAIAATANLIENLTLLENEDEAERLKIKSEFLKNNQPNDSTLALIGCCTAPNGARGKLYIGVGGSKCITSASC